MAEPLGVVRVLHLDLDAFFAAVEQWQKPSLRGTPVVVGGLGGRGVVATASYEARRFGVFSASSLQQARERCPQASFLVPRFDAYKQVSAEVMGILSQVSTRVEALSLDEAYLDLTTPPDQLPDLTATYARLGVDDPPHTPLVDGALDPWVVGSWLRERIRAATGCTASAAAATSRTVAKVGSDACKPDGLLVVEPGEEAGFLAHRPVRVIPGVGPATEAALHRLGITTCADLAATDPAALRGVPGALVLPALARGLDSRPVSGDREARSVSAESTFGLDLTTADAQHDALRSLSWRVAERLQREHLGARTLTLKIRDAEFQTRTRSRTLAAPTDDPRRVCEHVIELLDAHPVSRVRLLGVSAHGFSHWTQPQLPLHEEVLEPPPPPPPPTSIERMLPGVEVVHPHYGPGWVVAVGHSEVRVRFEDETTPAADPARDRVFETGLARLRVRTRSAGQGSWGDDA